jgi:hypothetical protein
MIVSGTSAILALPILATSSMSHAGATAPELQVGWTVNGMSDSGTLVGGGLGAGIYEYSAITIGDTFEINWSLLLFPNESGDGFEMLVSTLGVTNTGETDSIFGVDILLPVDLGVNSAFYGGSIGGSITGGLFGGLLSSVDGSTALWTAMIDGDVLAGLVDAPFELTSSVFGSADLEGASFGDPIPSLEGAGARESMSLHLDFVLGAGTTFAISSNYAAQIPAPGALALLGLAGVAGRRRRNG